MAHVCSHKHVWTFDNFLRPLIHNPAKIFSPYVEAGMRVMDVGCGAGFASLGLARLVGDHGRVVAVDVQPEMLAKVTRRAARSGLQHRIEVHQSSETELGVEGRFDFVNAFYMVHEVPETGAFLRQIYACLAPGGHFLVVEPKFHVSQRAFEQMLQLPLDIGFKEYCRPSLLASRAVVLTKNEIHR
jgi:ubiquinone/menaquinone biosynthesis C-methylase UbiE